MMSQVRARASLVSSEQSHPSIPVKVYKAKNCPLEVYEAKGCHLGSVQQHVRNTDYGGLLS